MESDRKRYIYRISIIEMRSNFYYIILTLSALVCGIIWSCTNFAYDGEYQLSMTYRFLKGDKMILEMWEPHQMSVFLPAVLMGIYMKLFHTTTGIVLYLQFCGILIRGGLALLLYRILREDLDESVAYGVALLYFMISPKDYALPDFSNMQLWYSTLLFGCLWTYLKKGKLRFLIFSALWLCLEVLAYPSCAIVLLGVALILAFYSTRKWRDILIFTGVCAGLGLITGGYFLFTIGPNTFLECIGGMLALEPTHAVSGISKILGYLRDIFQILIVLVITGCAGFGISLCLQGKDRTAGKGQLKQWLWLLCCAMIMLAGFFVNILSVENRYAYGIILLAIAGIGFWNRNSLQGKEKQIYVCGSVIGGLGLLATLILTDLPLLASSAYGLLMVVFALIPIARQVSSISYAPIKKGFYFCSFCFLALLAFRCVYIRTPLSGKGQISSVLSDLSIVRTGPALGIISDENGVCIQRDSYSEWKEFIRPGDKVWIVGGVVDTLGYLYENVEVAAPSTMSTPSYSSAILEYWHLNPDKYPDVVVAESYMGDLSYDLLTNEWLLRWIEEEYQPEDVIDGKYWKYYFRKAR